MLMELDLTGVRFEGAAAVVVTTVPASAPPARQTEAEATAQRHDAEVRLGAIRERRIVENEGRDSDGDLVFRDGKPHPAHAPGPR